MVVVSLAKNVLEAAIALVFLVREVYFCISSSAMLSVPKELIKIRKGLNVIFVIYF